MNDKILNEIDKIITYLKETEEYKDYIYLSNKLSQNDKAKKLINNVKKLQKEAVRKEVNNEDIKDIDEEINNNLEELNRIPLYVEFLEKQEKLNDMYQLIKVRLDNYFYEKIS